MVARKECKDVGPLLERFLDGELPQPEAAAVRDELAACEDCRKAYDRLQKLRALVREVYLDHVRQADLGPVLPGVMQKIAQADRTPWAALSDWLDRYRLSLASPAAPLGIAATVAVVVIALTLVYVSSSGPALSPVQAPGRAQDVAAAAPGTSLDGAPGETLPAAPGSMAGRENLAGPSLGPAVPPAARKNECYVTFYQAQSGTVLVDSDPTGETPMVLWHLSEDDEPENNAEVKDRI
jgi:hypothetical protein